MRTRDLILGALLAAALPAAGAEPVFTDVTEPAGVVGLGTILTESVAWGDFDRDGDPDLYLTNDGPNRLYRNDNGRFTDVTASARVGDDRFGVGAVFADLDGDADLDLYVVNFQRGPDVLYRNDGPVGTGGAFVFTDVTRAAGTILERSSRGAAAADYDRDGDLDLVITGDDGGTRLWRNDTPREHHWLGIRLRGAAPNTTAIGARVELRTAAGATVQEVSGGAGRGSQNDQALIFGLGDDELLESVRIRWPDDSEQVLRPRGVDRWLDIQQSRAVRRAAGRVGGAPKVLEVLPR